MTTEATPATATPIPGATQQLGTLDAAVEAELASMGVDGEGEQLDGDDQGGDVALREPEYDENGDPIEAQDEGQDNDEGDPAAQALEGEYQAANGKKYRVPQELIDGNLRHADYTQHKQALAQRWQEADQRDQQVGQLFQAGQHLQVHRAALLQIDNAAQQIFAHISAHPQLQSQDELQFSTLTGRLSMLQMQRQQVLGGMQQANDEFARYSAQQTAQRVARVMPVFQSIGLGPAELQRIEKYAIASGAPRDAIEYLAGANAPWAVVVLEKARQWDEAQGKRTQATNKVNQARKAQVLRPGAASTPQRGGNVDKANKRLAATGSVKDAVALELSIADNRARQMQRRR